MPRLLSVLHRQEDGAVDARCAGTMEGPKASLPWVLMTLLACGTEAHEDAVGSEPGRGKSTELAVRRLDELPSEMDESYCCRAPCDGPQRLEVTLLRE